MALALYRKYRPRTFAEVIGQEHVTEPLMQALRTGRLHHAYLFSGPRGCGKTSSARILARSLNCEKGPTPEPCGQCESCRALAPDGSGSIDVIEIDAASHGGVDDARELRERAFFAPVASRFKVYVIDEAHMVSSAGFNALLKLVEEPPDYVKFVFATTEPEKVLGTIKSRTHHYPFRLIPPGALRPYLEQLCTAEGVAVEPAVFPLVVRAGGGSARDSLSVLDQLIAGAGPAGVTYVRAAALLGVTDAALIDEVCDALAAGDGAAVYAAIDQVAEAGHDARRFASDLLERLRDLIVLQQVPDAAAKGLLDVPADQLERMAAQASRVGPATLSRFADIVHNGLTEMRGTTAPRLLLELICARMLLPGADDSTGALLQRLERMERRLGAAGDTALQSPPAAPAREAGTASVPATATTPVTGPTRAAVATSPAAADGSAPSVGQAAGAEPSARPPDRRTRAGDQGRRTAAGRGAPASAAGSAATAGSAGAAGSAGTAGSAPEGDPATAAAPPAHTPGHPQPADAAETTGHAPGSVDARGATGPAPQPADLRDTADATGDAAQPTGALDAAAIRRVWDEILTVVRRHSQRGWAVVREASVREVDGDTIVLLFRHAVHAEMLSKSPEWVTTALVQVFGGQWQVRCEVSGQPGGSALPQPAGRGGLAPAAAPTAAGPPGASSARTPSSPGTGPTAPSGDDWPTPARPGGGLDAGGAAGGGPGAGDGGRAARGGGVAVRAPGANGGQGAAAGPALNADMPAAEMATASGVAAPPGVAGATGPAAAPAVPLATTARGPAAGRAAAGSRRAGSAARGASTTRTAGTGRTATRAPARGTATGRPSGAAPGAPAADPGWRDLGDEPPYDPEYDPPVRDPGYPGFDPGDEPLDDEVGERVTRQSTEEQALQLLSEALGAERIEDRRQRP